MCQCPGLPTRGSNFRAGFYPLLVFVRISVKMGDSSGDNAFLPFRAGGGTCAFSAKVSTQPF